MLHEKNWTPVPGISAVSEDLLLYMMNVFLSALELKHLLQVSKHMRSLVPGTWIYSNILSPRLQIEKSRMTHLGFIFIFIF